MLLRPDQDEIGPIIRLLESVIKHYDLSILSGTITVVTPRGVRVRRTAWTCRLVVPGSLRA